MGRVLIIDRFRHSVKNEDLTLVVFSTSGQNSLTIALEPKYCGGLLNSLHLLDILNREFFDGTLCTQSCNWKNVKQ